MRMAANDMVNLALAVIGGLLLRWSFGLHPLWWLAWLAPVPLLVAALRSSRRAAVGWSLLAGLIGASANLHYLSLTMPLAAALFFTLFQSLLWVLVVCQARRVMPVGRSTPARAICSAACVPQRRCC